MGEYELAQVNVALAKDEMDSEVMESFVSRLDEINAIADKAPGFVWRLKTEEGNATSTRAFDDPLLLVNLSVWTSLQALQEFAYKSIHVELLRDRDAWFSKMKEAHQALWWIPRGHIPSVEEAKIKLEHIRRHGPSADAFTFAKPFPCPPPGVVVR
jgi:hypothetical protein